MADLSLGPLKITNPDAKSDAPPDSAMETASAVRLLPTVPPISMSGNHGDYFSPSTSRKTIPAPVSPMETPAVNSVQSSQTAAAATSNPTAAANTTFMPRAKQRESIPYSYQDQQQAQFPQYATMMPQNLHDPSTNASRAVPNYYTQSASNVKSSASGGVRENSYRMQSDASRLANSIPQRSTSRGSAMALQAGVPTRDSSHTERNYKSGQYTPGNGPVLPRQQGARDRRGNQRGPASAHRPGPRTARHEAVGSRSSEASARTPRAPGG